MTPEEWKEARTYAWGYFAVHADQRMKLFNFFLILSGLIIGAFPAVRGMAPKAKAVALLPLLLVLAAFIFWRLEERTRRLVKNGENALRFLDEQWAGRVAARRDSSLLEALRSRRPSHGACQEALVGKAARADQLRRLLSGSHT